MERIVCQLTLAKSLSISLPYAIRHAYKVRAQLLVYQERENPNCKGPNTIKLIEDKQVFIDKNGTIIQPSLSQLRLYVIQISTGHELHENFTFEFSSKEERGCEYKTFTTEALPMNDRRCSFPNFQIAK